MNHITIHQALTLTLARSLTLNHNIIVTQKFTHNLTLTRALYFILFIGLCRKMKATMVKTRVVYLRLDELGRAGPFPPENLSGLGRAGRARISVGPGRFLPIFPKDFANIPQFF